MLELEGVETFYGPVQALFGVDLALGRGEVVALMGRNGMGKTTSIRSILRLTPHARGRIVFEGRDLAGLPPHRAARLGLGLVPEGRRCFPNLTVAENLAATERPGPWDRAAVERLFPRLAERRGQMAGTLSGGEQQMLAIGRALMTNPRLLILDEATEGLAPTIRAEIWAALRRLKAEGEAILIVDKTLKELLPLAERCVILERGRTVWRGAPGELTQAVSDRYLGV
ncbi:MAG TPA: ABC transporter ATP-binding protein [Thermohalobaculum sp.]|nr:ABC transporter ATP-binding protein [Thermohalobaculum sp.]